MRSILCPLFLLVSFALLSSESGAFAQSGSGAEPTPTPQAQASPTAQPQASPSPTPPQEVPMIDAGAGGPCAVSFTILDTTGKPVYAATVKVHITWGTFGIHKMDLQAGTNVDGKVKFTGIPARVHNAPLYFQAAKGSGTGVASWDPDLECQGNHQIALVKP